MKKKEITLFNLSFGILLFMPQGWIIIAVVLIFESLMMSRFLEKKLFDKKIVLSTALANIISGIVGFFLSIYQNGGWWLVFWFPWVSQHEVQKNQLSFFAIYFIIAFILSVLIESIINYLFLRRKYNTRKVIWATLIANLCSYIPTVLVLYSLSFG
jgi:hypothetical protein